MDIESEEGRYDLSKDGFQLAMGFEDWEDGPKHDAHFLKFILRVINTDKLSEPLVFDMHKCTDHDMEKFYPPNDTAKSKIEKLMKSGGLFCFDWQ